MHQGRNSIANTMELRIFCIKPSICLGELMILLTFKFYTQG